MNQFFSSLSQLLSALSRIPGLSFLSSVSRASSETQRVVSQVQRVQQDAQRLKSSVSSQTNRKKAG